MTPFNDAQRFLGDRGRPRPFSASSLVRHKVPFSIRHSTSHEASVLRQNLSLTQYSIKQLSEELLALHCPRIVGATALLRDVIDVLKFAVALYDFALNIFRQNR